MKIINMFLITFIVIVSTTIYSQEVQLLRETVQKKYRDNPIDGAVIVDIGINQFLVALSSTTISDRSSPSTMNQVCMIKARREALKFITGSNISSSSILTTLEISSDRGVGYYEEFFDQIRETSNGWVQGMSELSTWKFNNGKNYALAIYRKL